MTRGNALWAAVLALAVVASGVAVVYAKFLSRALFIELQQVRAERDQVDLEWGRLQLELATSGAMGRVMRIAGERLEMGPPVADQIVVVE